MKLFLKITLAFLVSVPVLAQSNSPYTRKGIGDLVYSFSSRRLGIGQLGASVPDADFISTINPASWYMLKRTRAEFSMDYSGIFASGNSLKKYYGDANFNGVTFAFPISSLYGISGGFGIIPYSNVSYEVVDTFRNSITGSYKVDSKGTGGVSKIFIGTSYLLPGNLAAGATFDYYFGTLNYVETVDFSGTLGLNSVYNRKYEPKGIGGTFGLISPDLSPLINSDAISNLRIGAALNIISPLSTDTSLISTTPLDSDTLGSGIVDLSIPFRFNAGISFNLDTKYMFCLDYLFQPWSSYKFNGLKSIELADLHKISAGFEFRPVLEPGSSFWEQIIFRAGLGFERTQYYLNGENIQQLSVFGGLSIPFSHENTLDIGMQFAARGTTKSNLVQENMVKLNIGLSLGEIWFIREEK
ncbi:MAG TPA: hypothetical protein VMT35_06020 [Ignavibacteriaceae bacterium]|nr:hypothetical protein [Ignavibacteriaceae bacterium]